jgi:hypothetical protein
LLEASLLATKIALLVALAIPAFGQKAWKVSFAALAAGTTLDAASSYGRPELNPVLAGANGQFGVKGIAIKGGITVGILIVERYILKRHPDMERTLTMMNYSVGATYTSTAIRNWGLK